MSALALLVGIAGGLVLGYALGRGSRPLPPPVVRPEDLARAFYRAGRLQIVNRIQVGEAVYLVETSADHRVH
ncbi:MAG: hypothetical protein QJR02_10185 [Sinobacteraceae bacterium]|nr:hypothetical protein [Nevskiaceae bacterium]